VKLPSPPQSITIKSTLEEGLSDFDKNLKEDESLIQKKNSMIRKIGEATHSPFLSLDFELT